jgi:hypothetical protein
MEVQKEYTYGNKKIIRKYIRKTDKVYKVYNPRHREPEPGEVMKEYEYNGKPIVKYYKVKKVKSDGGNTQNLSTGDQGASIQQNL